uniref:NADH-ubiquinone oxidoreductase chain 2 n=1 Tax=Xenophora japonica TaxID=2821805 RepID=A0A8A6KKL9_9CAEN|nr:NADH dehydrogenase subunit 2 [Xenophora japonica]QTI82492.1 NADH dehydrogenase subunit 2 [Xenophora japonica]
MFSRLPFSFLFLFVMVTGTLFSLSSSHWLGVWAGLEINLIGFLPLLVYQKSMMESESGVKYFIVQALGSSMLMFGSLLVYNLMFTWEMTEFSIKYLMGTMIIIFGLFMKMGVFPFHFWLPGVMAGLPWMSCLLLATWQKLAPLLLVSSLMKENSGYSIFFFFCILASVSSLIGGIGGMNQTQVRALLAYSSIGHLGWLVFASLYGDWLVKMYLSIYILISVCIFLSLYYSNMISMMNLKNLDMSYYNYAIMLMLLSLGGLPPLLGFIPKWMVILNSVSNTYWSALFLLILGSLMSLFYYLSLFFTLNLNNMKKVVEMSDLSFKNSSILSISIIINLVGGGLLFITMEILKSF